MPDPTPNRELIESLKSALALAEQGVMTDGAVILLGPERRQMSWSAPHAMVELLGETVILQTLLSANIAQQRQQQERSALIKPIRLQS